MKRKFLIVWAILIASVGFAPLRAQTDVTSQYLTNTDFETDVVYTESDGTANGTPFKTTDGTLYAPAGWTPVHSGWSRAVTVKYGITFTEGSFPDEINSVNPPALNPQGNAEGAGLKMSAAWGGTITLTQETSQPLPLGNYSLAYAVYNVGSANVFGGNRFGFISADGTETYGEKLDYPQDEWYSDTVYFKVTTEAVGKITLGYISAGSGSASNPKIYVDDVKLIFYGVDKTEFYDRLNAKIAEALAAYSADGIDAAALNAAIQAAQAIASNPNADLNVVSEATTTLDNALRAYRIENASDDAPVDLTVYIENPNFDKGNTGWSWTTGASSTGTFVAETKSEFENLENYPNGYGDFRGNVWENWSGSAYTGKMYQVVSGLPNGKYTLSATAFSGSLKKDEEEQVVDPQDWFVLYANEGETPVTSPNLMLTYSVTGYVNDGTMEIGLNIKEAVGTWFGIDNFKLLFTGYDQSVAVAYLQERIAFASGLENAMQASAWTELQAAITQGNAAVTTPSKAALNEATLRLNSAITAAEASLAVYTSLADAIAAANAGKADYADFPGYTAFVTAIASAQSQYDGKQLDAEGIEAAIAALQRAEMLCRLTQQGENVDVTFVLQNPSFEKDVYKEDKAYNTPDGWILDFDYTSGQDAVIQTDEPFDGTNVFNIWSGTLKSIDLYQETDLLPPGLYSLSAMLRTEDEKDNGTQMVYALVDGMARYESVPYEFNDDAVFASDWETQDAWIKLTAEFYFETPGSTVRLGAHSEGDGETSAGWFQVDAFELILKERSEVAIHTPKTADNAVNVRSVKGGVNITTSAATPVHIYAITGQLVKTATVNGKSFVPLLRGIYIINHQKVIVIN